MDRPNLAALLASLCVLCSCAPSTEWELDEEASADEDHAITNASETSAAPQVVQLVLDGSTCSATMLTRHWLLTAAHCAGNDGDAVRVRFTAKGGEAAEEIYHDDVVFFVHPDYAGKGSGDRSDDIALVFLMYGSAKEWRGRLYADEDSPWSSDWTQDRSFTVIGWGRGSDDGSQPACPGPGTAGVKRRSEGWQLVPSEAPEPLFVAAQNPDHQLCSGDSGTPWMFAVDSMFVSFAVHSGGTEPEKATLIGPKLGWIEDTLAEVGAGAWCTAHRKQGVRYLRCADK
jgi:secreted trypsin-like serine protease